MGLEKRKSDRRREKRLLKRLRERMRAAERLPRAKEEKGKAQVVRIRLWILLRLLPGLIALLVYLTWF